MASAALLRTIAISISLRTRTGSRNIGTGTRCFSACSANRAVSATTLISSENELEGPSFAADRAGFNERWPRTWRTTPNRSSSDSTALGGTSPANCFTREAKECLPPFSASLRGLPRASVKYLPERQPATTLAALVCRTLAGMCLLRLSVRSRFTSERVRPVNTATLDWFTLPFLKRHIWAAAFTNANFASAAKCFGVTPAGRRRSATWPRSSWIAASLHHRCS